MGIGENIQKYRKKLGWSQEELAGKLGVSVSTIGMIETDKRNVKDTIKYQLCSLFNISISELMGDTEINFNILKNTIISIFLQYKTEKQKFNEVKQEILDIIENNRYFEYVQLKLHKETKDSLKSIILFSRDNSFTNMKNTVEQEDTFIKEHKEEIIETVKSIKYEDLKFNSFFNVYPQYTHSMKVELSILKNPFEDQDKYIGIKIESDRMIPKYEKGNIVIVQKSKVFANGQDVCFKNKSSYEIGRIFVKDNIVAIKYFNTNYNIQFFELEEFKKMYIGIVVSTRLYN